MTTHRKAPDTMSGFELLALACSVGLVPLNSTMIAVAIPAISMDLAVAPAVLMQWLVTSYLLVNIVAQSPAGKLGDRWGHARTLRLGQGVFAVGSVIGFLAQSVLLLAIARVLMALGGAIMVPAATATVRIFLPEKQRAKAFGMFGAVMGLSAAIGPLVGGEVASRFGWAALFLVNIFPLAIVGVLGLRHRNLRPPVAQQRPTARFDLLGSALLGAGLALIVLGAREASLWLPLVGAGLGLMLGFVAWERRAADPVIDLDLFARRAFATGAFIVGLQNFAMYALLFELPVVFSHIFGATPAQSGRALLAMTLAMVIGSVLGGHSASRFGHRTAAVIGTAVAFAGGLLLLLLPLDSVQAAVPSLLMLGLGLGLSTPAANAASMSAAQAHESGMASALSGTLRYLGGIAGVAVVGALTTGGDLMRALHTSTLVFVVALALAGVLAALIPAEH